MIYQNSFKFEDVPVRVGDVAKMLQVEAHTLRFWEKEFDFYLKPSRTAGLQRRYNTESIDRLKKIRHYLKEEGYSIAGAKRLLYYSLLSA
ncbi:MAG: MerR family transcriptional regulator [Fibromonadales bacterium]|nr:MerR family transcriptional regulator [Fibromonadales bacterium]